MGDKERIAELERKVALYEMNGAAKYFYAINRKMNEMAELLNKNDINSINLEDKEGKTFERLFKILEKSKILSEAAQIIQGAAGVTGDEAKDTQQAKFRITPESIADNIGELAGGKRN